MVIYNASLFINYLKPRAMNKKVLFIILMLFSSYGFSQISEHDLLVIPKEHLLIVSNYNPYSSSIEGSPFLDTTFTMGTIVIQGIKYDIPMRYNVLDNVFQVQYKGNLMYIKCDVIDTISYGNKPYIVKELNGENKVLEILKEVENCSLLKNLVIEYVPARIGVPFKENVYAHFEKKEPGYYFSIPEKGLINIFNFNSLYKYYPESKNEIKSFVKKNKLKMGNEDDLAMLLSFVSGLN